MNLASDWAEFARDIRSGRPHGVSRRAFSAGLAVSILLSGCGPRGSVQPRVDGADEPADPAFLKLSMALTGHRDLDPVIAGRMSEAFGHLFPDLKRHFGALATLSARYDDPHLLLAAVGPAGLVEPALAIVAAWYTGTIGTGQTAIGVAYRDALMNRPVADALAPPIYQLGGPAWWVEAPPPVRVSPPTEIQPGAAAPAKEQVR